MNLLSSAKERLKKLSTPFFHVTSIKIWPQLKQKREPTIDETILEYKGLLKSKTEYKENAIKNFKKQYENLKK